MSTSPYKKLKMTNKEWVGYIDISKLEKNKAFKILSIVATKQPDFGPGQQATVLGYDKKKWRSQLPGKYLAQLEPGDIDLFKTDISKGDNPFLVFREVMMDNSYHIDIIEKSPEIEEKFSNHEDIDPLELSLTEDAEEVNDPEGVNGPQIVNENANGD